MAPHVNLSRNYRRGTLQEGDTTGGGHYRRGTLQEGNTTGGGHYRRGTLQEGDTTGGDRPTRLAKWAPPRFVSESSGDHVKLHLYEEQAHIGSYPVQSHWSTVMPGIVFQVLQDHGHVHRLYPTSLASDCLHLTCEASVHR